MASVYALSRDRAHLVLPEREHVALAWSRAGTRGVVATRGYPGTPMELEAAQHEQYRRDGFLLLPALIASEQIARWEKQFEDLVLGRRPRPKRMVVMQDVMVAKGIVAPASPLHAVSKILSFEDDPVLFEYAEDAKLLAAIRSLIGPRLMTISSNVFNKPPGVDGRHPLHQDLRYFALRPADKIVACWTAFGRCRRANGCLAVIPGSHRGALHEHADPDWEHVNRGFFAATDIDLSARIHLEMDPGDTLLFHPLLVHGSGRNRSDDFRRAISVHYASLDCERPDGARKRDPVVRRIPDVGSGDPSSAVSGLNRRGE